MRYPGNVRREVAFRRDNTEGWNDEQLEMLNRDLAWELEGLEPYTDEWYERAGAFSDKMTRGDKYPRSDA